MKNGESLVKSPLTVLSRLDSSLLFLLLIGPSINMNIPVLDSGLGINITLYELAISAAALAVFVRIKQIRLEKRDFILFGIPIFLVVFHSLLAIAFMDNPNKGLLIKESIKYVQFFFGIFVLKYFLSLGTLRDNIRAIIIAALAVVCIYGLFTRLSEQFGYTYLHVIFGGIFQGIYSLENSFAFGIATLLFVYLCTVNLGRQNFRRVAIIGALTTVVIVFLGTKLFVMISAILLLWGLVACWTDGRAEKQKKAITLFALSSCMALLLLIVWYTAFPLYDRSFYASVTERLPQWLLALDLIAQSFPWGIGLGQFTAKVIAADTALGLRDLYPHNTPLGMLTELGLLGVVVFVSVLAIAILSFRHCRKDIALMGLMIAVLPMLLHDVLSFRLLQFLLAAGLAGYLSPIRNAPDNARDH